MKVKAIGLGSARVMARSTILLLASAQSAAAAEPDPEVTSEVRAAGHESPRTGADPKIDEPAEIQPEVLVVGKRRPPPGTVTSIESDEISIRGASDLPEVLAAEPGVELLISPKAGATIQIRGFDERAVLITMEDIPIREVYDGHFDVASLPVFSLGSVTIERGVTSLLHGPNSAGGVVAMKAPTSCDAAVDASTYGGLTEHGVLRYGADAKGCARLSALTIHTGAGYQRSAGYALSSSYEQNADNAPFHEGGGVRDGSDRERISVGLLASYAPRDNAKLSFFGDVIRSPRSIPPFEGYGYLRLWRFDRYDTVLAGVSGTYGPAPEEVPLSWGFRRVSGQIYVHVHRDEIRDYEDTTYTRLTTDPLAWFVASAYANETYGASIQSAWSLNSGNRLDSSLRYSLDIHRQREIPVPRATDTDWTPWERYASHSFSASVEDTQILGPWWITAGVGVNGMSLLTQEIRDTSYPVSDRVLSAVEGRIVAQWAATEQLRFLAAAGHKVRYPTLKELFSNSVGGNPDLQRERAWMGEVGFDSEGVLLDDLDLSARLFMNSICDLIERYRDAYANVGQGLIAGSEVDVRYQPIHNLQLHTAYRSLYSRDLEHDRPLDYRTPHRLNAGARLLTSIGLTCSLDITYSSGQEAYSTDAVSGDTISQQIPPYLLLGAHLRYEQSTDRGVTTYIFSHGSNLLDTNYYSGSFEPRPGREIVIGFGARI